MASTCDKIDFLILGAGISGLAAGQVFREAGRNYAILEAAAEPGGLTRTISIDQFNFDYTGHLLHLAHHKTPSQLPYCGLKNDEWKQINRRSFCYLKDTLIPAPIQYHLASLPSPWKEKCIKDYYKRPRPDRAGASSFRDTIVSGFGHCLSELFLIPQNEKTYAVSLDRLSSSALTRFFPAPDERRVKAGIGRTTPTADDTYNSQFWYPRNGGIRKLVDSLERGQEERIYTRRRAISVDLKTKTVLCENGETWSWKHLLSSVPLKNLCLSIEDEYLPSRGRALSHASTLVFNIGLKHPAPAPLRRVHWIYVPDREVPFYRVGFYSNFIKSSRSDNASLYVEIGIAAERLAEVDVWGDIFPRVLEGLERFGWMKQTEIACLVSLMIPCSYIHHTPAREKILPEIKERLNSREVYPIGRYGTWDYCGMEDSILSAINEAKRLL